MTPPATGPPGIHPKVKAGGTAGFATAVVVAAAAAWAPDLNLDPTVAAGVGGAVVWLVETAVAYMKRGRG